MARALKLDFNRRIEMRNEFWESHDDSLFGPQYISLIRDISISGLDNERSFGTGPLFRKIEGKVLYRKKDVLDFINSFPLKEKCNE